MVLKKQDFPIFEDTQLIYVDNAATTQKPQQVIDRISHFYAHECAPVARGMYSLAEKATAHYEQVRQQVQHFIGAQSAEEIIFTSGATEGINIVAFSWARQNLKQGDEIVLSELEHHANLVPWQRIAQETGAVIRWLPITADLDIDYTQLTTIITEKTKLVAIAASSNVVGVPIDIESITARAHKVGAKILIDAAQAAPRTFLDVHKRGFDFLVFSGHKMLGPTGIGVLFVKREIHSFLTPFKFGGGMVLTVDYQNALWREVPYRCEAGSPPTAQVLGLGAALDYMTKKVDFAALQKHEAMLCSLLLEGLRQFPEITVIGPREKIKQSGHLVTFVVQGVHALDVASYLDRHGICVRAGMHCAQPLHTKIGLQHTVRVSFYGYNTPADVHAITAALAQLLGR